MATQKPISTISYNSEPFLREKLENWYNAHIIQAYQYIFHHGEGGDKDHIHLRIEPNRKLDPMTLSDELREYIPNCEKPLCCLTWRPSKEEDWVLYVVHDDEYLKLKYSSDENEKLPYDWQDIRVPENYDMRTVFVRAKASLKHSSVSVANRLKSGEDPLNLIFEGESVYLTNALLSALNKTDYSRAVQELKETQFELFELKSCIARSGFKVAPDENGELCLVPARQQQSEK